MVKVINFIKKKHWKLFNVAPFDIMKIALLPFLTQPRPSFWSQKTKIWNSLKRILIFNQSERQKLYYYVTLSKVKTLKIIICHFWPNMAQNVVLISLTCGISSYTGLKFPFRYFYHSCYGWKWHFSKKASHKIEKHS